MGEAALDDLKVIELGDFVSAPFGARLLADLGAEVIKVEPPQGESSRKHGPFPGDVPDPEKSGLFLFLNFNKQSITLNLETVTGLEILKELLHEADILVGNLLPSYLEALGLDYPALEASYPGLIVTSITPYGCSGPYSQWTGTSLTAQALSGLPLSRGEPGREPLAFPAYLSQFETGLGAAIATLEALFARDFLGQGQHVDVSEWQFLSTFYGHTTVLKNFPSARQPQGRRGARAGAAYPFEVLQCKDGYVYLIIMRAREWQRMLEMIGNPEWSTDPKYSDRVAIGRNYADEVDALMLPWFMQRTKREIFDLCREHSVPFAPVNTAEDLVEDPHLQDRDFFIEISHPRAGTYRYPGAPYKWSEAKWEVRYPAPLLGQHNQEILQSKLGYSHAEIARLRGAGVV